MEYIECIIFTTHEGIEVVGALLQDLGISSFQIEDQDELKDFLLNNDNQWDYVDEALLNLEITETKLTFYIPKDDETLVSDVKHGLYNLKNEESSFGSLNFEQKVVDDSKWLNAWKEYYKPFLVGENIIVRPFWEEYEKKHDETVLTINPGNIFGTGLHESTRMCMKTLEKKVRDGFIVADFGTGSGILAVLAMLLGAEKVFATEIEESANEIVFENAKLNGLLGYSAMPEISIYIGDILNNDDIRSKFANNYFDIVCANIVADVIIPLAPIAFEILKPGGVFISSGIIKERTEEIVAALEITGFIVADVLTEGEWSSVVCEKDN